MEGRGDSRSVKQKEIKRSKCKERLNCKQAHKHLEQRKSISSLMPVAAAGEIMRKTLQR